MSAIPKRVKWQMSSAVTHAIMWWKVTYFSLQLWHVVCQAGIFCAAVGLWEWNHVLPWTTWHWLSLRSVTRSCSAIYATTVDRIAFFGSVGTPCVTPSFHTSIVNHISDVLLSAITAPFQSFPHMLYLEGKCVGVLAPGQVDLFRGSCHLLRSLHVAVLLQVTGVVFCSGGKCVWWISGFSMHMLQTYSKFSLGTVQWGGGYTYMIYEPNDRHGDLTNMSSADG